MQKLTDEQIYAAIKSGFRDFQLLARGHTKKIWAKMSLSDKCAAGRALVSIGDVARRPEKYFSRDNTLNEWVIRAEKYGREHNFEPACSMHVFYIVQSPMDLVVGGAVEAFHHNPDLYRKYYNFCRAIQNWEYDRTSKNVAMRENAYKFGEQIIHDSRNIGVVVEIEKSHPMLRPIKRLVHSFQR